MIGWLDFWIWGAHYHHHQGHARRRPRRWRRRRSTSIGVLGNVGGLFWGDWVVYGCLLFGKNFKCILMVETLGKVTVLVDLLTHCFCGLINWSIHWLCLIQGRETREVLNAMQCHWMVWFLWVCRSWRRGNAESLSLLFWRLRWRCWEGWSRRELIGSGCLRGWQDGKRHRLDRLRLGQTCLPKSTCDTHW